MAKALYIGPPDHFTVREDGVRINLTPHETVLEIPDGEATDSAVWEPIGGRSGPTVDELRDQLRALDLPTDGKKTELVERLEAHAADIGVEGTDSDITEAGE